MEFKVITSNVYITKNVQVHKIEIQQFIDFIRLIYTI